MLLEQTGDGYWYFTGIAETEFEFPVVQPLVNAGRRAEEEFDPSKCNLGRKPAKEAGFLSGLTDLVWRIKTLQLAPVYNDQLSFHRRAGRTHYPPRPRSYHCLSELLHRKTLRQWQLHHLGR